MAATRAKAAGVSNYRYNRQRRSLPEVGVELSKQSYGLLLRLRRGPAKAPDWHAGAARAALLIYESFNESG